ncbi:MAG: protein-L-isoaspartate(D-aspartate) O-methyltransferase [candidate division WOR-3 bacterium]|nr:protein-L-isoaspartate(D-aspartate) O-methyltransferase [candidate division WOR-3 bacterium]
MQSSARNVRRLIEVLKAKGIKDARVIKAFGEVPRHLFVPPGLEHKAYQDAALPIGGGQTISAPSTVAAMLAALQLSPCDRVLEIGTGSGFQTALLTRLAAEVYSIERNLSLVKEVGEKLIRAGCGTAQLRAGDGMLGWSQHAPYDAIIVSAGTDEVPPDLADQLKLGGRMVIPLKGRINLITKTRGGLRFRELSSCQFVPLLPGHTGG